MHLTPLVGSKVHSFDFCVTPLLVSNIDTFNHHDPAGGVNFELEESMFDPKGGVNLKLKEGTFDPTSGVKCILNASEESSLGLQPILAASLEAT